MSAFMIDRKDYLAFAVQLHRFCNAPCHRTTPLSCCAPLVEPPMDVTVPGRGG
jgi:hypothetical protein